MPVPRGADLGELMAAYPSVRVAAARASRPRGFAREGIVVSWRRLRIAGRRALILPTLLLILAIAGCASSVTGSGATGSGSGSVTTGSASAVRSTPPGGGVPAPGTAVRVRVADSGRTFVLHVGQLLIVTLAPNWTPPRAQVSESVSAPLQPLRTDRATGFPASDAASAMFTAVRVGTAVVSAQTDYACLHTTPRCLPAQQWFTITVQVLPGDDAGGGPLPVPPPS